MSAFYEYVVLGNLEQEEKVLTWQTASGLQDVDGLKVLIYLLAIARQQLGIHYY